MFVNGLSDILTLNMCIIRLLDSKWLNTLPFLPYITTLNDRLFIFDFTRFFQVLIQGDNETLNKDSFFHHFPHVSRLKLKKISIGKLFLKVKRSCENGRPIRIGQTEV